MLNFYHHNDIICNKQYRVELGDKLPQISEKKKHQVMVCYNKILNLFAAEFISLFRRCF